MKKILSVNAGSSSLKFSLFEMPEEKELINGYVEKIGQEDSFWTIKKDGEKYKGARFLKDHNDAVEVMKEELINHKVVESLEEIEGVGHRILHGGEKYSDSVLIDEDLIQTVKDLTKLGPLHHPGNIAGIEALRNALPEVKMVGVFDTAFHQTIPEYNYMYAVPYEWYTENGVRKYGFHGTSYKYITKKMNDLYGKGLNMIVCHIGSGGSMALILDDKVYDTTMGFTPLDGIMMGTRCGSIDPSIIEYIANERNLTVTEINNILNKKSGLLGVAGKSDCRDVESLAEEGNHNAQLALKMYQNKIIETIGKFYFEAKGKIDYLVLTAGVGENGVEMREAIIEAVGPIIGINLDKEANKVRGKLQEISTKDSKCKAMVVPTNEELMIAIDTYEIIER